MVSRKCIFLKRFSSRQVGPKQREDRYWAARNDLATLRRKHSAATQQQKPFQHRKLTVPRSHSWPPSWPVSWAVPTQDW